MKKQHKHFICVNCGKQLINLSGTEELSKGISRFWCDECNTDYTIEENREDE